jgi:hypothetical protein
VIVFEPLDDHEKHLFHLDGGFCIGSLFAQIECHENAARVRHIVGEGRALNEAMPSVQSDCRPEVVP